MLVKLTRIWYFKQFSQHKIWWPEYSRREIENFRTSRMYLSAMIGDENWSKQELATGTICFLTDLAFEAPCKTRNMCRKVQDESTITKRYIQTCLNELRIVNFYLRHLHKLGITSKFIQRRCEIVLHVLLAVSDRLPYEVVVLCVPFASDERRFSAECSRQLSRQLLFTIPNWWFQKSCMMS